MRKFLIPIVAAASTLAIAAPASAQRWAPPVYQSTPYNYNRFEMPTFTRAMHERVARIQRDVREMQARRILSWREARSLEVQADNLQRRIWRASRNGIQPGEARGIENQIRRLEWRVQREASDWNNRPGGYRHHDDH